MRRRATALGPVAAAFSRIYDEELDNDIKASYNAFSPEITSHIIPHLDDDESEKYETLSKQYANQSKLLSKMKRCHDGSEKAGLLVTVAIAFSRIYDEELDNDIKASYNAFSPEITSHIIPHLDDDESEKYDNLLKHYELNELLSKMKGRYVGVDKTAALGPVAAAFSRIFDEELDNDVKASYNAFSSEVTSHIIPHLDDDESEKYDYLLKQYDKPEDLLSKMKSHQAGVQKSINSREKNKTDDGRSKSNMKTAAKCREQGNGAAVSNKQKAAEVNLAGGILPYSDSRVPSSMKPILVECPRGDSCTRKGERMSEYVFYDDGRGYSNSMTGYVASVGWKHVLNDCGSTSCGGSKRLVPVDEANKESCIRCSTIKKRISKTKKDESKPDKKKRGTKRLTRTEVENDDHVYTREELEDLNKTSLHNVCKWKGVFITGKKREVIDRYLAAQADGFPSKNKKKKRTRGKAKPKTVEDGSC